MAALDKNKVPGVRFPIGMKLMFIIGFIVVVSLGIITYMVNYFDTSDVKRKGESNNFTVNGRSASAAESFFSQVKSNVFLFMDIVETLENDDLSIQQAVAYFFERNEYAAGIFLVSPSSDSSYAVDFINKKFVQQHELPPEKLYAFIDSEGDAVRQAGDGETLVLNSSPALGISSLALLFPWYENGLNQCLVVVTSIDSLDQTFGVMSTNVSYLVNSNGDILVHPDNELVKINSNISTSPVFIQMMETDGTTEKQISFKGEDGAEYFGAFQKLNITDCGVITTIKTEIIYENVVRTTKRNIYFALSVFFLAILFIWIYSKSITVPLHKLTGASEEIENGHYNIKIESKSHDEISILTHSFVKMSQGLAERERLKDTFGKFINKEIAEKALKGNLTLGGETKDVTVFFSDIRSFTAISEKLTPAEVVEFLNQYMTRMVKCVNKMNGVVDKYIGDAIMCVWGAPASSGSVKKDALSCVCAALMMRHALMEFNKGRGGDKKPIIRIGCGINTGPVIAGQIGSKERMEYTVIGDAVNLASRTEALNKPFGTDILITENTYKLIKEFVTVEKMPSVSVKGKSEPISMYAVINIPNAQKLPGAGADGPKSLGEVRKMLGIPEPDLSKVNPNESEKKYKIKA